MAIRKTVRKKPSSKTKTRSGTTTKTTYSKTNRRGKTKAISEKKYTKKTNRLNKKGKAENRTKYELDISRKDRVTSRERSTTAKKNRKGKTTKSFTKDTKKVTTLPKKKFGRKIAEIKPRKAKRTQQRTPSRTRR